MANFNPAIRNVTAIQANVIDAENYSLMTPSAREIVLLEAKGGLFPDQSFSANVWDNRLLPWDGVGVDVSECLTTEAMAHLAGIDFPVEEVPLFIPDDIQNVENYLQVPNKKAILRVNTLPNGKIEKYYLGDGSANMGVIPNKGAGSILDAADVLHKMGFSFVNAGMFDKGKVIYITLKSYKEIKYIGEIPVEHYLVLVNSFDGSKPFMLIDTPICPVCKNSLNMGIKKATWKFVIRHTRNAPFRVDEMKQQLNGFIEYQKALEAFIEKARLIPMSEDSVHGLINLIFPINEDMNQLAIDRAERKRADMFMRYNAPDLVGMEHCVMRTVQMLTDYYSPNHVAPLRQTTYGRTNNFEKSLNGNSDLDKAIGYLDAKYNLF